MGLLIREDVRVVRLSGGQRKRVAVGVELLHRPGALFLDEPTTGLDPGLERHMSELFRELANTGQTVALVTHATGSLALYDRVIVMGRGGKLRFDGSPSDLLEAFLVDQFDDVYTKLSEPGDASMFLADSRAGTWPLPPLAPLNSQQRVARPVQQTFMYQTQVLAVVATAELLRDRKHLRSALIQVPILGLLTALLFNTGVFDHIPFPHEAAKSTQLICINDHRRMAGVDQCRS